MVLRELWCMVWCIVEGGHRAVLFSRLTGIQKKVYLEGLHFRYTIIHKSVDVNETLWYVEFLGFTIP